MKGKWFYIDITLTCHERIAVKAEDEESAKEVAEGLVDAGTIDFASANGSAYGSIGDSITVAEWEPRTPPKAMRRFDAFRGKEIE